MSSKLPVVAVMGTTGAGKTKLSVDIAKAFDGEVINADAMQVYRGLDIITNKATKQEMQGIPHHLMDIKDPGEQMHVTEWVTMAMRTIDDVHSRKKLPIIVGGTSYWLQNLLFTNRLVTNKAPNSVTVDENLQSSLNRLDSTQRNLYARLPDPPPLASVDPEGTLELWKLLEALDPDMASRWHWKDSRKVLRSLQIIAEHGRMASDVIRDQDDNSPDSRYQTLVFWPYTQKEILDERLDCRVDDMVKSGLLDEIRTLHQIAGPSVDHTSGIYQSIGFKEFEEYLRNPSVETFRDGVEAMKRATRKYAVYQTKWTRRKFIPLASSCPDTWTYILDTSNPSEWEPIKTQGVDITSSFLMGSSLPSPSSLSPLAGELLLDTIKILSPSEVISAQKRVPCDVCTQDARDPFLVMASEWVEHTKSRNHQRKIENKKKRERNMERLRLKLEKERIQNSQEPPLVSLDEMRDV